MYRWVGSGKRYVPGRWRSTEPSVRAMEGTVLNYTERLSQENFPECGHKDY